ncbi:transmembrane protein, putative (macronuclear) [Tetrahymena thermophila SB210]|uniref:Transmembrane protein, putative n=1 Tax=Tetrahymena thermophila (strain SB210) TaxID=312017 RepID=W7XGG5_TETTS|nr:transmembrane protein, putative [Tetrahymena thermophila SB210]EWS71989.1 transmembrane protein, putative [Tetrahymena thermophila SB210]|eukprot:XP_012655489.1 transmembrane protein, putative [Tetrahymena thermophila SB210]
MQDILILINQFNLHLYAKLKFLFNSKQIVIIILSVRAQSMEHYLELFQQPFVFTKIKKKILVENIYLMLLLYLLLVEVQAVIHFQEFCLRLFKTKTQILISLNSSYILNNIHKIFTSQQKFQSNDSILYTINTFEQLNQIFIAIYNLYKIFTFNINKININHCQIKLNLKQVQKQLNSIQKIAHKYILCNYYLQFKDIIKN